MSTKELVAALNELPTHTISGYEWECENCHYHFSHGAVETTCATCGRTFTDEGEVDSAGNPTDHSRLVDLDDVLKLIEGAA